MSPSASQSPSASGSGSLSVSESRSGSPSISPSSSPSFSQDSYFYACGINRDGSAGGPPALFFELDIAAIVGHNLPFGSAITVTEDGGEAGTTFTLTPGVPSFYSMLGSPVTYRYWELRVLIGPKSYHARPVIGELWMGLKRDTRGPVPSFTVSRVDLAQASVIGAVGHIAAWTDGGRPYRSFQMTFKTLVSAYKTVRDALLGATREGVDPMLLIPLGVMESEGIPVHGRIGKSTQFTQANPALQNFSLQLEESPFPRI